MDRERKDETFQSQSTAHLLEQFFSLLGELSLLGFAADTELVFVVMRESIVQLGAPKIKTISQVFCLLLAFSFQAFGQVYYNIKDYGAVGDGVTDDTNAIKNTRDAAGNVTVLFPAPGNYRITEGFVIASGKTIQIDPGATVTYAASGSGNTFEVQGFASLLGGGNIISARSAWDSSNIQTGVLLSGSGGKLECNSIRNFEYAISLIGAGQGCAYNNVYVRETRESIRHVNIDATVVGGVNGAANQNYVQIDRQWNTTSRASSASAVDQTNMCGLYIDTHSSHVPNTNRISGSFEGGRVGARVSGQNNRLDGMRLELPAGYLAKIDLEPCSVSTGGPTVYNYWIADYGSAIWKPAQWADGVTNGTTTISSATAAFVASDVNKYIVSRNPNNNYALDNIPANTTIASIPSDAPAYATTIAVASDAAVLPQATINVVDTTNFASAGNFTVIIGGTPQTIAYTAKTGTTFTGCTGGSGTLATGQVVGGQWAVMSAAATTSTTGVVFSLAGRSDIIGPSGIASSRSLIPIGITGLKTTNESGFELGPYYRSVFLTYDINSQQTRLDQDGGRVWTANRPVNVFDIPTYALGVGLGATTRVSTTAPARIAAGEGSNVSAARGIMSWQAGSNSTGPRMILRKTRGSISAPTVIFAPDVLGELVFSGYDGTSYLDMANIKVTSGTVATTKIPTKMELQVGTNATPSVLTTTLTLDNDLSATFAGKVVVGGSLNVASTVTSAGNTGTQTINKARGTVRFAAGADTLVVTNNLVTSTSKIIARGIGAFDTTATNFQCTAANGSFTIRANAAAFAETEVAFDLLIP